MASKPRKNSGMRSRVYLAFGGGGMELDDS